MSDKTFVATVAEMKKEAGEIPGQTCPHIDDALGELRRAKDHLRAAVKDRDGAYWWECDSANDDVDDAMGKLESLRKDNERLRELGREWYENAVLVAVEADARLTTLERDLSEARRERDEARAQLDTYIRTAAEAVAEQGRCEAAGRVLAACYFWRSEGAVAFLNSDKMVMRVNIKISEADDAVQANPLALAWVKAAQEASQP